MLWSNLAWGSSFSWCQWVLTRTRPGSFVVGQTQLLFSTEEKVNIITHPRSDIPARNNLRRIATRLHVNAMYCSIMTHLFTVWERSIAVLNSRIRLPMWREPVQAIELTRLKELEFFTCNIYYWLVWTTNTFCVLFVACNVRKDKRPRWSVSRRGLKGEVVESRCRRDR